MKMKIRKSILLVVMAAVFTLLAGMSASAKTRQTKVGAPINGDRVYFVYSGPASGIADVKSSNRKVAEVVTEHDESDVTVYLRLKKTGTTSLSYKTTNEGKTEMHNIKLCVYKHKNPFRTLKVGNVSYKSQFSKGDYSTLQKGKGKVQVKVRKGWKVKTIKVQEPGKGWRKLKKNEKVDIPNKNSIMIILKNRKYGFTKEFWIWGGGF